MVHGRRCQYTSGFKISPADIIGQTWGNAKSRILWSSAQKKFHPKHPLVVVGSGHIPHRWNYTSIYLDVRRVLISEISSKFRRPMRTVLNAFFPGRSIYARVQVESFGSHLHPSLLCIVCGGLFESTRAYIYIYIYGPSVSSNLKYLIDRPKTDDERGGGDRIDSSGMTVSRAMQHFHSRSSNSIATINGVIFIIIQRCI